VKRELLCEPCGDRSRAAGPPPKGEWVVHRDGIVRVGRPEGDVTVNGEVIPWVGPCVCDLCASPLPRGAKAVCRSQGRSGSHTYVPWESTYLEIER